MYIVHVGLTNSWTIIQNDYWSVDKGWQDDIKYLSWRIYISVYRAKQLSRVQIGLWKDFWIFVMQTGWLFFSRGGSCFLVAFFRWRAEGPIKVELRRNLLFLTLRKNVLLHWDESKTFLKVCVIIWGGKRYEWRQSTQPFACLTQTWDLCLGSSHCSCCTLIN